MYENKRTYSHDYLKSDEERISRAVSIAREILAKIAAGEISAFSKREYCDKPLIRTGRQLLQDKERDKPRPTPQRILEMRGLAKRAGWHNYHYGGSQLFYEQASFMADFEDDCDYTSHFSCYYPTYEDMSNLDARAYFSWRTKLKNHTITHAPLSFLFVYAYELLCKVGVASAQQAMTMLGVLRDSFCKDGANRVLDAYLQAWMLDFAVWHDLPLEYAHASFMHFNAVYELRELEQKLVQAQLTSSQASQINEGQLFELLCNVSSYHLEKSKLYTVYPALVQQACARVFIKMVNHCKTRRKTGYIDGLFGPAVCEPYTMFSGAIFYTPQAHADQVRATPWHVVYSCHDGRWTISKPCKAKKKSGELGNLLYEIDVALRQTLQEVTALKPREIPKYQRSYVTEAVQQVVEEKNRIEAAQVSINLDSLAAIRSDAAQICEVLLVEEERALESECELAFAAQASEETRQMSLLVDEAGMPLESKINNAANIRLLGNYQKQLLQAVLEGKPLPKADVGSMLSVEVDHINELLYDLVDDTVLEFDGQRVSLVEDYRKDVEEFLRAN
ncbi:TerB N-terminal domain-containing protein [Atopobium minutum]|uniref:TerB N-terminal domain-containing protein n=1 Tax=Atopobium minutum TaxID=1381 RepID=UPI00290FEB44|nr:TerB N-terminal domain-containing protein [Atopobium minutum]MDU5129994.1 TerB N-terminal domain-containing protein [Atopobium minutum]